MRISAATRVVLCCAVLAAWASPALADDPSTLIGVTATSIGLSPSNVYGPWQFATLDILGTGGKNDKYGLTVITRQDLDTGAPSSGTSAIVYNYHQWSPQLFTFAQVQVSSGTVFPTRGAYVEVDPTVKPNFVIAGGYGVLETPIGLAQRYANFGPEWYFTHGSATVRYIPLWTEGQVGASSLEGDLSLGDEGKTVTLLTLQGGVAPAYAATNPAIASEFQDRVFAADLSVKHWFQPRLGFYAGIGTGHSSNRFTGQSVYNSFGGSLGIFIGVGHSPEMP